ncbi:hypothetical protein QKT49_gp216 [Acanthamoeba castellanii medusavirus]|uniref:Uncharacterized protein n=1 Tax=Acanthamoeba castellanii medusavirus J1 TaxID=3114988 RepID=A0A3T1CXH3_9VIRU|nr:hypothetical protein QKT49_gp216 [Acanthamoeba castellanii medusavirus]BBI30547.1 hypothetical protein [Acanthamoeba castellanii medusavirus J1]
MSDGPFLPIKKPVRSLTSWEVFTLVVLLWGVISLWSEVLHNTIKHVIFAGSEPNPLYLAIIALILTALLFDISRYLDFDFVKLVGGD